MDASKNALQLQLPSTHESLETIVTAVEQFSEVHAFNEDFAYRLLMVATEGATNAIRHGNKFDKDKPIQLELRADDAEVHLWVRDEGGGFDPTEVADPLDTENMLEESGRGLFLIEHMADQVTYETEGRTMHAVFQRPSQ